MVSRTQRRSSRYSQAYNDHEITGIRQIEAYFCAQEAYSSKTVHWLGNTATLISRSSRMSWGHP